MFLPFPNGPPTQALGTWALSMSNCGTGFDKCMILGHLELFGGASDRPPNAIIPKVGTPKRYKL